MIVGESNGLVHYGNRDVLEGGVRSDGRERDREGILHCVIEFCGHTHALSITRYMFVSDQGKTELHQQQRKYTYKGKYDTCSHDSL